MKRFFLPAFLLCVARGALAVNALDPANDSSAARGGRLAVAVGEYRVANWNLEFRGDWDDRDYRRSRRGARLESAEIEREAGRAVRDTLRQSERFVVSEMSQSGSRTAGDYLVSGQLDIDCEIARTVTRRKERDRDKNDKYRRDRDEYSESFAARVTVAAHHQAREAQNDALWKELEVTKTRSQTFSSPPDEDDISKLARAAFKDSAPAFVRALVPSVEGRVVSKDGESVVLDIGRLDGVGTDVDFTFARDVALLDARGAALHDANGIALTRRLLVAAQPSAKHKKPLACVARPGQIEDKTTLARLGYNGSGGFFGPDVEWKQNDNCLAAVRAGDIVILTARPASAR